MAPRYYNMREVCAMFKVSKSTIYNWISKGEFPEGKLFSARCRRWSEEELKDYENSLKADTEGAQGRKALSDRTRASSLGGASTRKRAKAFWDEVFELQFKPTGWSPEEFAARHCEESSPDPLRRTYASGSTRAFTFKTILDEMRTRVPRQP